MFSQKMTLPWNGSFIGSFPDTIIVNNDQAWWTLNINGTQVQCFVRADAKPLACIADELKPIFGLAKNGTHRIKIGKKFFVLTRPFLDASGAPTKCPTLSDFPSLDDLHRDPEFTARIQKIFMYRDLLGLAATHNGTVGVCQANGALTPFSFKEINTVTRVGKNTSVLTKSALEWFDNTTPYDVVKEMTRTSFRSVPIVIAELRTKIRECVERIDPEWIWFADTVLERTARHLVIDS